MLRVEQKHVGHWRLVGSKGPWFHLTEDRNRIAYILTTKIRLPVKQEPGRENGGAQFSPCSFLPHGCNCILVAL